MSLAERTKFQVLAPIVRGKKGRHEKVFESAKKSGYVRVIVDGNMYDLSEDITLDKNIKHNIEIVVDRLIVRSGIEKRLTDSIENALKLGNGLVNIDVIGGDTITFSQNFACVDCGISIDEIQPRSFSFNHPFGACPDCYGLGYKMEFDVDLMIPDKSLSINEGAIVVLGWQSANDKKSFTNAILQALCKKYKFDLDTPFEDYSDNIKDILINGTHGESVPVHYTGQRGQGVYDIAFEGLVQMEVDELCQTNGGELTLQRLLDLAYSVDCCHVVPGIRDDAALGRFYVENEFLPELEQVPESVLELLDYAKIGEKMRRDEHGAMTPNGYVVREAELRQAPPNLGRPPRKPPYMIHFLCVSDVRAVKLYLPAKQAELDAVLDCLEVDSWQEVQLEECDTAMPEMWAFVDMAHTSMEQVNQFAQCLEMLDANGELAAFKAVASQLDIYKLEDAMALTEHLSEYAFEPNIHSLEDRAREELSLMADGPELDLLIRNLNLTAYGADLMYRDRGILSDYGYVHRPDGQPMHLPQQGMDMTMQ